MAARDTQIPLVTPEWLAAHLGDPQVRVIEIAGTGQEETPAYRAGHVPGAVCWQWKDMLWDPLMRDFPSPAEFARRCGAAGIGNDTTVVFYGEGVQFGFYAWWVFTYCGHRDARVLDGGRYSWGAEGRPLVTEVPSPAKPVTYEPAQRIEAMRVSCDGVLAHLGEPGRMLLDGRSPQEYRGERVNAPQFADFGAVRAGRIPGAQHLYFEDLFDGQKRLKPAGELRAVLEARAATRDKRIVTYCRMSHRATVLYFVLTRVLGYPDVRVYDGSWTEWGNMTEMPVER